MKFETKYHVEDYIGKEYGYLTVTGLSSERAKDSSIQWTFHCKCGNDVTETPYRVLSGHKRSCGCMSRGKQRVNPENYIGKKNNHLAVVGYEKPESGGRIRLVCKCDCGRETKVLPYQFDRGGVKSCGCMLFKHSVCFDETNGHVSHGMSKSPYYGEWMRMVARCHNPNDINYKHYGARGIYVCDEWRNSIKAFVDWAESTGGRPDGKSLDRIDNDGPYAPWNCRWATQKEQTRNKRDNIMITYKGKTQCLTDWAIELGMNNETLRGRIVNRGWTVEQAFETPVGTIHDGRFKNKPTSAD